MGEEDKKTWATKPLAGEVALGEGFGWMAEVVGYRALETVAEKVAEAVVENLPKGQDTDGTEVVEKGVRVVLVDSLDFLEAPFLVQQVRSQLKAVIREVCAQYQRNKGLLSEDFKILESVSVAGILAGLGAASDLLAAVQDVVGFFRSDYQVTSRKLPISSAHAFMEVHRALSKGVRVRHRYPAGLEALLAGGVGTQAGGDPCTGEWDRVSLFQLYEVALEASLRLRDTIGPLRVKLPPDEGEEERKDPAAEIKGAIEASEELVKASGESLKKLLEPRQGESQGLLARAALWDVPYDDQKVFFLQLIVLPTSVDVAVKRGYWNPKEVDVTGGAGLAWSLFKADGTHEAGDTVLAGGRARYEFWAKAGSWSLPTVETKPVQTQGRESS